MACARDAGDTYMPGWLGTGEVLVAAESAPGKQSHNARLAAARLPSLLAGHFRSWHKIRKFIAVPSVGLRELLEVL